MRPRSCLVATTSRNTNGGNSFLAARVKGLITTLPDAFGYSRDSRPDCLQVCIGLVVTEDGIPLGYEVFAGNRHDSTTVEEIVEMMERKYGRARRIWVMDRGMVGEKNLNYGAEEIAVIFDDLTGDEAYFVANRVREAVAATGIEWLPPGASVSEKQDIHVTVSCGVASNDGGLASNVGTDLLVRSADEALYHAKPSSKYHSPLPLGEGQGVRAN
jgi:hypothetical protein